MVTKLTNELTYKEIKALVEALNALHWKADYEEFCKLMGYADSAYGLERYAQFENLCKALNSFNLDSLVKLVKAGVIVDYYR